jgi:DNA repair exonuclease SbcCD ATPase subunit
MLIKKLKIEGFKMIGDPVTVNFPGGKKVIGILGEEATGKSTLLESILFAIFGIQYQDREGQQVESNDDLITWGKEKARVVMDFNIGKQLYRIQRIITKNGSESARLTRIIDGTVDYQDAVEGVIEVAEKVESLLGLDADTYSTFFYIWQDKLRAFNELSECDKRQLLRKAFAIEPFDQEIKKLVQDRDLLRTELEDLKLEFERVSENKQTYEKRLAEKEDLELTLAETKPELISLKNEFEERGSKIQNHMWRSTFDSLNRSLTSEIEKSAQISKQQDELFRKQQHLSHCEQILGKYRGEVEKLKGLLESATSPSVNNEEEEKYRPLHALSNYATKQRSLSGPSPTQSVTSRTIVKQKQQYLALFLGFLATGIVFMVLSFFTNTTIFILGMAALIASIFVSRRYDAVNGRLLDSSSDDDHLENKPLEISVQHSNVNLIEPGNKSSFDSPENIRSRLSAISKEIESETGQEDIDQLEFFIAKLKNEIGELLVLGLQNKQDEVTRRISNLQNRISKLKKEKAQQDKNDKVPVNYGNDEGQYLSLKTKFEKVNETASNLQAVFQRVEQELKLLNSDYDLFPILENKLAELRETIFLLDETEKMLSETCAQLMNSSIEVLVVMLNRLLPQLDLLRYRNIEITNSLQLNVYSSGSETYEPWKSLSQGVKNQFVLAVRLALAHFALNAEGEHVTSPLLLDGCISGSEERKGGSFRLLRAMEDTFSQIIIANDDKKLSSSVDFVIKLTKNNHGFTVLRTIDSKLKEFAQEAS